MNFSVFVEPNASVNREEGPRMRIIPMQEALSNARRNLPLNLNIVNTTIEDDHVIYHCQVTDTATSASWTVSYRYNEFDAFKNNILDTALCSGSPCSGSCQAVRDYLVACFPKKRLLWSTSVDAIEERTQKFESMLLHLLRCILIPGKVMRCYTARHLLPECLFSFLRIENPLFRRSILQIFVDNYQANVPSHDQILLHTGTDGYDNSHCTICMEDVTSYKHDNNAQENDESRLVVLPCRHIFHRRCVFEWLLFQTLCPLCRTRIGHNSAAATSCREIKSNAWKSEAEKEEP